jgi:hypothetical protein
VSTYSFADFGLKQMTALGQSLRDKLQSAGTLEQAASDIAREVYDGFAGQCVLVRFFRTIAYEALEPALQQRVRDDLGHAPLAGLRCLTLLGTAGEQPAWNSRHGSQGHQAIPLTSRQMIEQSPMIAQLIRQLGMEVTDAPVPSFELLADPRQTQYNIFHVEEAVGSPYIPAQDDFVRPHGVRSVVGFGGLLPQGDIFALIIFSRVPIDGNTARLFNTVGLNLKMAMLGLLDRTFVAAS